MGYTSKKYHNYYITYNYITDNLLTFFKKFYILKSSDGGLIALMFRL